jgi:hypothetical protein
MTKGLLEPPSIADRSFVTGKTLAELYCIGGAMLGLWALVRFPSRAPSTLTGAMFALMAAVAATAAIPAVLGYCVAYGGKTGAVVGLVGMVLPALAGVFWSTGSLFRILGGLFDRSVS